MQCGKFSTLLENSNFVFKIKTKQEKGLPDDKNKIFQEYKPLNLKCLNCTIIKGAKGIKYLSLSGLVLENHLKVLYFEDKAFI
jgi:hypothetical protein